MLFRSSWICSGGIENCDQSCRRVRNPSSLRRSAIGDQRRCLWFKGSIREDMAASRMVVKQWDNGKTDLRLETSEKDCAES